MKLPKTILMYPMTLASQAAHLVMRFQQNLAELVIKGDTTLEHIFPPKDEQPEWATFDEDLPDGDGDADDSRRRQSRSPRRGAVRAVPRLTRHRPVRLPDASLPPHRHSRRCSAPAVVERTRLRAADAGPAAGPAAIAGCRRTRSAAGLRRGHQGPCPVPDAARQQDHPRDREVTANSAGAPQIGQFRREPLPGSRGGHPGRGLDRQARHRLGRRAADPDQHAAGRQDRVHGAARPGRRHVADRDLSARLWS